MMNFDVYETTEIEMLKGFAELLLFLRDFFCGVTMTRLHLFGVKWSFENVFCLIFRHFNCHARENNLSVKVKYLLSPLLRYVHSAMRGKEFHFPESFKNE